MQISDRLKLVVSFVEPCKSVADIGTDHGYVPIALVKQNTVNRAYAMDINVGPLERAEMHIREEGLEEKIEVRQSDGLENLKENEAETVIIAGMGGELTVRILKNGEKVLNTVKTLILSPHSEVFLVRKYLLSVGYDIVKEEMIFDAGKYYTVMKAVKSEVQKQEPYDEVECLYGKRLIQQGNRVLRQYLEYKKQQYVQIVKELEEHDGESVRIRRMEIEKEIAYMDETIHRMYRQEGKCNDVSCKS